MNHNKRYQVHPRIQTQISIQVYYHVSPPVESTNPQTTPHTKYPELREPFILLQSIESE